MPLRHLVVILVAVSWCWTTLTVTEASLLQNIVSWIQPIQRLWDNILSRFLLFQRLGQKSICYDLIGCFHVQGAFSHFRQVPEPPNFLKTELWVCTNHFPNPVDSSTQLLDYHNSSKGSVFQPGRPIKVLVHGYGGHIKSSKIIAAKNAFLQRGNVNVILMNWKRGAGGKYRRAVENAELVGRQAGKILLRLISNGTHPSDIHVIGFSLGAQVAGFIGETFKQYGFKLGQITGLDPASLLFESRMLPAYRRLDHSDADYVEVIHTDGSRIWSDGFGLLTPVGHVDYFPNGGIDQPGCKDTFLDVLAFGLNNNANSSGVCSHGRSWDIFLEMLTSPHCQFVGFSCPGLKNFRRDFLHGNCFQSCNENSSTCGVFGHRSLAAGALYFVTRPSKPYCGQQLKAAVMISPTTYVTRGVLSLKLFHESGSTDFLLGSLTSNVIVGGREMSAVVAAEPGSISVEETPIITVSISFVPSHAVVRIGGPQHLLLDHVSIMDHHGNRWQTCRNNLLLESSTGEFPANVIIELSLEPCL